MDKQEKEIIVAAIASSDGRVTAADLVCATGLPILCVNRCLNALAYDCGAHLEVSSDGLLTYLFPQNFAWMYRTGVLKKAGRIVASLIMRFTFFLVKLVFGSILFFSLFLIYAICFTVLQVMAVFSNMESAAAGMKKEFFDLLLCYLKLPSRGGKNKGKVKKTRLPAFFDNCFAFLFGPADPNQGKESELWKAVVNVIAESEGVVIPEQLRVWSRSSDYDKFDLSVLIRLDGMPLVTEEGEILYYFPSLLSRAESADEKKFDDFLEEKIWHFSGVSSKDLIPVIALALVNLLGCNLLYFSLHALPLLVIKPVFYGLVTLLWIYGNTFLIFPLLRIFICARRNDTITKRNVDRKLLAEELRFPSQETSHRIEVSKQMASEMAAQAEPARVIFSTEKDSLEQFILE